jgi:hypothetical protein
MHTSCGLQALDAMPPMSGGGLFMTVGDPHFALP